MEARSRLGKSGVQAQAAPVNEAQRLPVEVVIAFCCEYNVDRVPVWRFACASGGTKAQAAQEGELVTPGAH